MGVDNKMFPQHLGAHRLGFDNPTADATDGRFHPMEPGKLATIDAGQHELAPVATRMLAVCKTAALLFPTFLGLVTIGAMVRI